VNDKFWWQTEEGQAHEEVIGYVRALEEEQKGQHLLNIRHAKLYAARDLIGLDWSFSRRTLGYANTAVSENVIMSVVDTATATIAKNRPRVAFVTDGADFSTQRKAKQLERFIEGVFQQTAIYGHAVGMFRDAGIFGTGTLKIHEAGGRVAVERVLPWENVVDEQECIASPPQQRHRRKFTHREALKAEFPEHCEAICRAGGDSETRRWNSWTTLPEHLVAVVESWRLPLDDLPGRHTICIDGATLLDEDYDRGYFPFIDYRWTELPTGFYGQGLAEQLTGIQLRINKLNKFIDRCQDLISAPSVWLDVASRVQGQKLNNDPAAVHYYRGKPPVFMSPQALHPEVYNRLETLKRSAFEFAGISQLAAQSKKPGGLESAVALREFNDIESQRFSIQAQAYEQVFLEAARQMVAIAKDMHAGKRGLTAVWKTRDLVKRIDWADVDMDEDQYSMTIEAASLLSRTPAGRSQAVIEWAQAGIIDTEEARRLLGHPDLDRAMDIATAAIEDIEATIEELLDGDFRPPEPFQNLALGIQRVQAAYLKARRDGAPEDTLEGFRQWIEQAQHLLEPPAPPTDPMAQPEAAMPGPMGPGGEPPVAAFSEQANQLRPAGGVVTNAPM
jgi:hypothetical protein